MLGKAIGKYALSRLKGEEGVYIFLSYDLVGSTAFKDKFPSEWTTVFLAFYAEMLMHQRYLEQRLSQIYGRKALCCGFWKLVGDEALFYFKVTDVSMLFMILCEVLKALPMVMESVADLSSFRFRILNGTGLILPDAFDMLMKKGIPWMESRIVDEERIETGRTVLPALSLGLSNREMKKTAGNSGIGNDTIDAGNSGIGNDTIDAGNSGIGNDTIDAGNSDIENVTMDTGKPDIRKVTMDIENSDNADISMDSINMKSSSKAVDAVNAVLESDSDAVDAVNADMSNGGDAMDSIKIDMDGGSNPIDAINMDMDAGSSPVDDAAAAIGINLPGSDNGGSGNACDDLGLTGASAEDKGSKRLLPKTDGDNEDIVSDISSDLSNQEGTSSESVESSVRRDILNSLGVKVTMWVAECLGPMAVRADNISIRFPCMVPGEVRDFLGREVDEGFRIAKFAEEGKVLISPLYAWLLSKAMSLGEGKDFRKYLYDGGRVRLKGVSNGQEVPLIFCGPNEEKENTALSGEIERIMEKLGRKDNAERIYKQYFER